MVEESQFDWLSKQYSEADCSYGVYEDRSGIEFTNRSGRVSWIEFEGRQLPDDHIALIVYAWLGGHHRARLRPANTKRLAAISNSYPVGALNSSMPLGINSICVLAVMSPMKNRSR